MLAKTATLLGLASAASAHMIMTNPVPFLSEDNLDNHPLEPDGSNFPCKKPREPNAQVNTFEAGSTQQLEFQGQAVHGGGSCQVSITTDKNPTKESSWRVIKSIEGGCPAKDTAGNLGSDSKAKNPFSYDFKIPEELPSGEYVISWSWFNKVGNPEMYQNCGVLEVTGGGDDEAFLETLPEMFTANIGGKCQKPEGSWDYVFPNPGKDVERLNGATSAWFTPGPECTAGGPGSGSGGGSPSSPGGAKPTASPGSPGGEQPEQSQQPEQPEQTQQPEQPEASAQPSTSAPVSGGAFKEQPTDSAPAPPAKSTPAVEEPTEPGNGGDAGGAEGAQPAGSPCQSEGAWNCLGSSFQRCGSGAWSEVMPLAAGMSCEAGEAGTLSTKVTRGFKHSRRFVPFKA